MVDLDDDPGRDDVVRHGDGWMLLNPGPETHVLRPWLDDRWCWGQLVLVRDASGCDAALDRLLDGGGLDDEHVAALGRANSQAYLGTFAPIALLMPDRTVIDPTVAMLLLRERERPSAR